MSVCCFSGHRILSSEEIRYIESQLPAQLDGMMARGVTDFLVGGAIGFDMITGLAVARKKARGENIRLILALPCRNHYAKWSGQQIRQFHELVETADEVRYIADEYYNGCMKKRNFYMVDRSAYCVGYCRNAKSGSAQTLNYANQKGKHVINLYTEKWKQT